MNVITRIFISTWAALQVFDRTAKERSIAWDIIENDDDIIAAEKADRDALAQVQHAFYLDTADINSRANCALVDICFMRRMASSVTNDNVLTRIEELEHERVLSIDCVNQCYACDDTRSDEERTKAAQELWDKSDECKELQILKEFVK